MDNQAFEDCMLLAQSMIEDQGLPGLREQAPQLTDQQLIRALRASCYLAEHFGSLAAGFSEQAWKRRQAAEPQGEGE